MAEERLNIYKAARTIKRKDNSLYNALLSIYEDSIFVEEISQLWPELTLLANLRCGLWYSSNFDSTCYFKSTDGHNNNWSFNTSRLNLHVAHLAGQKEGCIIVDSTRRGKRFPDSMSKTIPIWTCVLNRAIVNYRKKMQADDSDTATHDSLKSENVLLDWDCSLHLPLWVSKVEKQSIEDRLEDWTKQLDNCGADIASVASSLQKPLRPLWISQKSVIWLNEVPDYSSWDFTPIILVTASASVGLVQQRTSSEFSWHYISGAGDDEESWARGLTPNLFWKHSYDLVSSGPDQCNHKVADIVEKDRVYRAQRGQSAPQISIRSRVLMSRSPLYTQEEMLGSEVAYKEDVRSMSESTISWLGSTNIAVSSTEHATNLSEEIDCVLNCDSESNSTPLRDADAYLHLPILTSKFDRFSLLSHLPSALKFAQKNLRRGKTLLVCCRTGEDISICISLAILTSLYNDGGCYDDGKSFEEACISKWEMRRRLVFICEFATNARPSRGNLKQVFSFLNRDGLNAAVS